jgi:hypothetical protein
MDFEYSSVLLFIKQAGYMTVTQLQEMYANQEDESAEFTPEQIQEIVQADPTYQGGDKVGSYGIWILKQIRSHSAQIEDLEVIRNSLELFNRVKPNLEIRDIYQYSTVQDLYQALQPFEQQQSQSEISRNIKEEGATRIYDDGQWLIVAPHTFEAECLYGANTKWCTTGGKGTFDKYMKEGQLYIIIDKNSGKKFQTDPGSKSFLNELDRGGKSEFLNLNPPEDVFNFVDELLNGVLSNYRTMLDLVEKQGHTKVLYEDNTWKLIQVFSNLGMSVARGTDFSHMDVQVYTSPSLLLKNQETIYIVLADNKLVSNVFKFLEQPPPEQILEIIDQESNGQLSQYFTNVQDEQEGRHRPILYDNGEWQVTKLLTMVSIHDYYYPNANSFDLRPSNVEPLAKPAIGIEFRESEKYVLRGPGFSDERQVFDILSYNPPQELIDLLNQETGGLIEKITHLQEEIDASTHTTTIYDDGTWKVDSMNTVWGYNNIFHPEFNSIPRFNSLEENNVPAVLITHLPSSKQLPINNRITSTSLAGILKKNLPEEVKNIIQEVVPEDVFTIAETKNSTGMTTPKLKRKLLEALLQKLPEKFNINDATNVLQEDTELANMEQDLRKLSGVTWRVSAFPDKMKKFLNIGVQSGLLTVNKERGRLVYTKIPVNQETEEQREAKFKLYKAIYGYLLNT